MNILPSKIHSLFQNPLFKDSFWALFGNIIGKGLSVLSGILVARFLGREIFGEFGMVQSTLINIGIFSTFGLGYTATKYIAEFSHKAPARLKRLSKLLLNITLVSSGIICLLVLMFASDLAILIKAPHLTYAIRLCSIVVLLNGMTLTQIGILSGFKRYKEIARNNTLSGILSFFLCLVLTYRLRFNGAMYSLLISQLFNYCINRVSIEKTLSQSEDSEFSSKEVIGDILKFSLPVALQESMVFSFSWLGSFVLIYFSDYGQVGLYSAASQWSAIILFVPGILRNVTLSHLSSRDLVSDHIKIMKIMILVNVCATLIPYLIVILFQELIVGFYGTSFENLGRVMLILNASTVFNAVSNVFVQEYMALNRNWHVLVMRFIKSTIDIALTIFLMVKIGIMGSVSSAIGSLVTSALYMSALAFYFYCLLRQRRFQNI